MLSTVCEPSSLLTQLSEIIFYAAPGVFSDKGLDQAPWLLLVLHISVDPSSRTEELHDRLVENIESTDKINLL